MGILDRLFLSRNNSYLADLQDRLIVLRQRRTPEGFYRLGKSMEAYRDLVRDYLDGLRTTEKRAAAENKLYPAVHALVEGIDKLTEEAVKDGILLANGQIGYDLRMLGCSLVFVSGFTKFGVVDPPATGRIKA